MNFLTGLMTFLYKVGLYVFIFLCLYFGVLIFLGSYSPEIMVSYFEIGSGIDWTQVVFNNWLIFKKIALVPVIIGLVISGVLLLLQLFKEKNLKKMILIIFKFIFILIFGIIGGYLLLTFDKSLNNSDKILIKKFIVFRLLGRCIQLSFIIASVGADLLMVLRRFGVGVGQNIL